MNYKKLLQIECSVILTTRIVRGMVIEIGFGLIGDT